MTEIPADLADLSWADPATVILLLREGGMPALLVAAAVYLVRFVWTTPAPAWFSMWPRRQVEVTMTRQTLTAAAAVALKSARIWRGDKRIPSADTLEEHIETTANPPRRREEEEEREDDSLTEQREQLRTPRMVERRDAQRPPLVRRGP